MDGPQPSVSGCLLLAWTRRILLASGGQGRSRVQLMPMTWTSGDCCEIEPARPGRIAEVAKRALDLLAAWVGLALSAPALFLIALAILVESGPPVLFRAHRLGREGKPFIMYKFRTMVPDAESRLADLAHLNKGEGMVKIPTDPRVTKVGRLLRRFSLDELPQLWNVARGDMSLVGPRPHDIHEIDPQEPANLLRLAVRPGLTGLWQVAARGDPRLGTRVGLDLEYVRRRSLLLDLRLLAATLPIVFLGLGDRVTSNSGRAPATGKFVTSETQFGTTGPDEAHDGEWRPSLRET